MEGGSPRSRTLPSFFQVSEHSPSLDNLKRFDFEALQFSSGPLGIKGSSKSEHGHA